MRLLSNLTILLAAWLLAAVGFASLFYPLARMATALIAVIDPATAARMGSQGTLPIVACLVVGILLLMVAGMLFERLSARADANGL